MVTKRKLIPGLSLVLSGLLVFFAARTNPSANHPRPQPSLQTFQFDSIHMMDRQIGWAENAPRILETNDWVFPAPTIWRTTNGGKSWSEVFHAIPAGTNSVSVSAFFLDSKTAWVAIAAEDATNVTVLRSKDGGKTWRRSQFRKPHLLIQNSWLSFAGADDGWLMLIPDHGMSSSPGDLYRTRNGGASWKLVNSTGGIPRGWFWEAAARLGFTNQPPFLFCGGSITLVGDLNGWLRGSFESTSPAYLFGTRDGGRNWVVPRLPLPASLTAGRMDPIALPIFFHPDGNEQILPAEFRPTNDNDSTNIATVIYQTHDGGLHWQPTTPVKFSGIWNFITVRKGWVWSPEPHGTGTTAPVHGTLYRTGDGGVSWKPTGTGKSIEQYLTHGEDIVQLNFVDDQYGWAIARDYRNLTQLLHTTDGGETWVAIQTMVAP